MEDSIPTPARSRFVSILLWLIPTWLIVSAGVGIFLLLRHDARELEKESPKFVTKISVSSLSDDLAKIETLIGPRNPDTNSGEGLTRAASWIEGSLGPSNTGYIIDRIPVEGAWPILYMTLKSESSSNPAIWLIVGYDTPPSRSKNDLADANAALLAQIHAAQAVAGDTFNRPIHFAFLPSTDSSPRSGLVTNKLLSIIREKGPVACILTLQNMGRGTSLSVAPNGSNNPQLTLVGNLPGFTTAPFTSDGFPAKLSAAGIPVIRIETLSGNQLSLKQSLYAATQRLVELIRHLDQEK